MQEIILVNKELIRLVIRKAMPVNTLDGEKLSKEITEEIFEKYVVVEKWLGG